MPRQNRTDTRGIHRLNRRRIIDDDWSLPRPIQKRIRERPARSFAERCVERLRESGLRRAVKLHTRRTIRTHSLPANGRLDLRLSRTVMKKSAKQAGHKTGNRANRSANRAAESKSELCAAEAGRGCAAEAAFGYAGNDKTGTGKSAAQLRKR